MSVPFQTSSMLTPPRLLTRGSNFSDVLEVSVHTLPKQLQREFQHVFAEKYLDQSRPGGEELELLAIPTNQQARVDLVNIGDHVEAEKDRLLNTVSSYECFPIIGTLVFTRRCVHILFLA